MLRKLAPIFALCVLLSSPAVAQSTKILDPSTGLPVFSAANPASVTVVGGSGTTQVVGNVASGAADSGNPVKIGGVANNAAPTAVTANQRVNAWYDLSGATVTAASTTIIAPADGASSGIYVTRAFDGNVIRSLGRTEVFNNTSWDLQRGDVNGIVVQAGLSSTAWTYASGTTGILNNTTVAVTVKAAAGASVRNFIDSCQISTTAFTTSVPLALRDGAGGTVIWSLIVPTVGFTQPFMLVFQTPLRSTANTLLEIVTTTANTTGTAMVNCQGHTGS